MPVYFASPMCLLGLLPWLTVALYTLQGRRRRVNVPFLELWPRAGAPSSSRRRFELPPFTTAVLAAMFLAILSAAGPQIRRAATSRPVTLILDRGFTMSARQDDSRRFQALAADSSPQIAAILGPGKANLLTVPSGPQQIVDRANWPVPSNPTAADTRAAVTEAVNKSLENPQAIVILLSGQNLHINNPRLVQIVPAHPLENIGINNLAVRAAPIPQAMVWIKNDSPRNTATLNLTAAAPFPIALGGRGNVTHYFVNLSTAPPVVQASITPGGDIDADDRAWAVRQQSWPTLAPHCPLPPELQRMVDVYRKDRPASADSATVNIAKDLPPDETGIILPTDVTQSITGPVNASDDSLTQSIDWSAALHDAQVSPQQPGDGWTRLLWAGNHNLLASRPHQLWIGFRSAEWATTPDYVLFWARAFNALGAGQGGYTHEIVGPANLPLWPGLYANVAVNAPAVSLDLAAPHDWQTQLKSLAAIQTAGGAALSSWLLLTSLACLLFAASILR